MQNVTPSMLKTSIFMTSDDFTRLVTHLFPGVQVDYALDGISYDYEEDSLDTNILHAKLAGYFDVKEITSIHSDDCDCIGVWITYKD